MTTSREPTVFISHSHRDNELVRDLVRRLRAAGLHASVDVANVHAGANWKQALRKQIRSADAMLILVTPATLSSDWVMTELGMAEGFERIILPVTVGLNQSDLPDPLRTYEMTPFDEVDGAIAMLSEKLTAATIDE